MKNYIGSAIIGACIIITSIVLTTAYHNRNRGDDLISVTGLGKKDFDSDLIVWSGYFSRKNMELQQAYALLAADRNTIHDYLVSKGVKEEEMLFSSVNITKDYTYVYDDNGNSKSIFAGYLLSQDVQLESGEVDKIEKIAREVSELINQGVEFYSTQPEYYYTKLAELKIEMIAAATEDGRVRAEQVAVNAGSKLGKLRFAKMGVFQIIARNSSEDFSWGGSFNTYSRQKTATITMKLQFGIK